jgi:hypothetical protein
MDNNENREFRHELEKRLIEYLIKIQWKILYGYNYVENRGYFNSFV